tara:strand:+ start:14974 stop:17028 length:2055 start_codon:yes stop_codon:yes gene_type:complete
MAIIETVASSRRKTKENVRIEGLIPLELREEAELLTEMLDSYYDFMNLFGHFYKLADQSFFATVINSRLIFRGESNDYFYDIGIAADNPLTILYDSAGNELKLDPSDSESESLNDYIFPFISGTNNLPEALINEATTYGSLFMITDNNLSVYENEQIRLVTPIIKYTGDAPTYSINTLLENRDIDTITDFYLEQIQKEIAAAIPRKLQSEKKLFYKNIVQFYRERGSAESINTFFRVLLNDDVEVKYPYDDVLIPSNGQWDLLTDSFKDTFNADGSISGQEFTTGKAIDNQGYLSDNKRIQDSFFYQRFSYLLRTGSNLELWGDTFEKLIHPAGFKFFGEIVIFIFLLNNGELDAQRINSSMPKNNLGLASINVNLLISFIVSTRYPSFNVRLFESAQTGAAVLNSGALEYIEFQNLGWGYSVAPTINLFGVGGVGATFVVTIDSNGRIVADGVTNAGIPFVSVAANGGSAGGSAYTSFTATVDENPSKGSIQSINVSGGMKFDLLDIPTITIGAPTSIDPVGTQAIATVVLDQYGYFDTITLDNPGSGYQIAPTVIIDNGFMPDVVTSSKKVQMELMLLMESDLGSGISNSWVDLIHFFDNTPMYNYGDITFEAMDNEKNTIIDPNSALGTYIYQYDDQNFDGAAGVYPTDAEFTAIPAAEIDGANHTALLTDIYYKVNNNIT